MHNYQKYKKNKPHGYFTHEMLSITQGCDILSIAFFSYLKVILQNRKKNEKKKE